MRVPLSHPHLPVNRIESWNKGPKTTGEVTTYLSKQDKDHKDTILLLSTILQHQAETKWIIMQVRWRQKDIMPKSSEETSSSGSDYTIHEAKVAPKLQCSRGILLFSLQNSKRQTTASMVTEASFLRRVAWNFERESFNSTTEIKFPDLKDLHIHEEKIFVRFSSPPVNALEKIMCR